MSRGSWEGGTRGAWEAGSKGSWEMSPDVPPPEGDLIFGRSVADGRYCSAPPEILKTHLHVVGATGVGKTFFLEGLIKTLILSGQGVCVIDPHGDLYGRLVEFCAYAHKEEPELALDRKVIPFNIAETRHLMGFNPVRRNARTKVYQVVALMEAVRKCWGQGSFQETPRLARWLFNTIYGVIDAEATFLQAYNLVDPQPNAIRTAITKHIKNPHIRAEWEWLARIKSDDRREERVESCLNRIRPFVEHEIVRHIIGQYTNTLDFDTVLSGQKVLLVNLARQNVISDDDRHLVGTLLVNELLTAAFSRKEGERPPYYLFIDEFEHFVTKDICEILDGGRKFGLHLVLAHQHLSQLREKDPEVYFSTLTNARTKVVFGGLIDEDLDVLAKELYTGELNPDEIKDEIWQTKFQPVESTRVVVSESESSSESISDSEVSHESLSESGVYIPRSDVWSDEPTSISRGAGSSFSVSTGTSSSASRGVSESKVPWYEYHEFRELSSRTFRSLEEQLYLKKAQMKRQPQQHAVVLMPGRSVEVIRTPTLDDPIVSAKVRNEFLLSCMDHAGCFKTPEEAEHEVRTMEETLLLGRTISMTAVPATESDEEFFE